MQSVYDKDIGKLWIIFFIALIFSISLIWYSYSYPGDKVYEDNYSLTTVYNSGKNTCCTLNNEYKISVIGYNLTNENIDYQIYANLNNDFIEEDVILSVTNKNNSLYQEFYLKDLSKKEFLIGNFTILSNTKKYLEEYQFELKSSENLSNNDKVFIEISVRY